MTSRQVESILLVDDNPTESIYLQHGMKQSWEGCDVSVHLDSKTALERVREDGPDCLLLDLSMPDRNGFEVAHAIRTELAPDRQPVIVGFTGNYSIDGDELTPERFPDFDLFLAKPADIHAYPVMVRNLRRAFSN